MVSPLVLATSFYSIGIIFGKILSVSIWLVLILLIITIFSAIILTSFNKKPLFLLAIIMLFCGIFAFQYASLGLGAGNVDKAGPIKLLANGINNKLLSVITNTMEEPYSSLLGSVIFGTTASPIPYQVKQNYKTAGVIHLLVVSGSQVSIIVSTLMSICGMLMLPRSIKLLIITAANILFTIMTGAGASIVRAAIMSEVALIAMTFDRDNDFYNSLSISALVLLIFKPLDLFDIGFQLSFVATWALFYVSPVFAEKLEGYFPKALAGAIALSIAPTLATSPIILYNFGQFSFVSFISNFLILPWIEITVIMGFASTMIGLISLPIAWAINNCLTMMLFALNSIVNFFASVPFAMGYFPQPKLLMIIYYYIMLIMFVEALRKNLKIKFAKAILLTVFVFLLSSISFGAKELTVTFFDVGQGDAILVESPSGQNMLIDDGERSSWKPTVVNPILRKKGINKLDYIVLTHPHDDHLAGLPNILERMKVDNVFDSGQPHTSKTYIKFLTMIEKKKIKYQIARLGQTIDLGGGVKGLILSPSEPLIPSDLNENSIVIRLVYGNTAFLLAGDLGHQGESRILKLGYDIRSDVLKVGHHGSSTSTTQEFLDSVKPQIAVISVGENTFGHPNPGTLKRLEESGAIILRTDVDGTISIKSDGEKVWPAVIQ
jgi:competence protein ComEC